MDAYSIEICHRMVVDNIDVVAIVAAAAGVAMVVVGTLKIYYC